MIFSFLLCHVVLGFLMTIIQSPAEELIFHKQLGATYINCEDEEGEDRENEEDTSERNIGDQYSNND